MVAPPHEGGYHPIFSVFQMISFSDDIIIKESKATTLTFVGATIPKQNTCASVLAHLKDRMRGEWDITVYKNIPLGAGLGGGSSNAGTLLRALNQLEDMGLSQQDMVDIAAQIGSDVPFFIYGGQCGVSGYGEHVVPVQHMKVPYFILLLPNIHCSTPLVYSQLDVLNEFDNVDELNHVHQTKLGFNRLQAAAFKVSPSLGQLYQVLLDLGAKAFLSGSGSTLFVPFKSKINMDHAFVELSVALKNWDVVIKKARSINLD